jgi:branched-chain amino acid transport system ATP-binding protein
VWIEHIVHALLAVVRRLVVISFGRLIADGEPAVVMADPQVQELYMGVAPDLDEVAS